MIDDNSREFIRRHIGPSDEDIEKNAEGGWSKFSRRFN